MNQSVLNWLEATLRESAWAPILVFFIHVFTAKVIDIYSTFAPWDIPMQVISGIAIAYFYYRLLTNANKHLGLGMIHQIYILFFTFALTGTTTIFWEYAEWISDHFFGTRAQLGLDDTLKDMLMGMLGGVSFLIVRWHGK